MSDSATPWTAARQASLSFTISGSLLKVISTKMEMLSNHLMLCCPLFLLPSIFPSTRVLCIESALHIKWLNYWSFIFSRVPENSKEIRRPSSMNSAKKQRKTTEWERLAISSRKFELSREHFMQGWA